MFELDRFHSQALTGFGRRKLAMSLLGGAGESRTIPLCKIRQNDSETLLDMRHEHELLIN